MANVIGLTGQTGAGKSSVREMMEEKGFAVIDADSVSHDITENNVGCITAITDRFSLLVLNEKGTIDRKKLGRRVFSDKKELVALNKIIFPYIMDAIEHEVEKHKSSGAQNIVIDGATIIESGCIKLCNTLISVVAEEEIRTRRIKKRDGLTRTEAERRISSQKSEEFYTEKADFIIRNNSSTLELERQVNSVLKNMLNKKEPVTLED